MALRLESEVKRRALEARYGFTTEYGELTDSVHGLKASLLEWRSQARRAVGASKALDTAWADVERRSDEQMAAAERFERHDSELKRALRQLPETVDELRACREDPVDPRPSGRRRRRRATNAAAERISRRRRPESRE